MALTVIAAYDIRDNDRRAHMAALLQAYGNRIQKSVFLLNVDVDELTLVHLKSTTIIDVDTDSLWLARQCATCWESLVTVGQAAMPDRELCWVVA